MGNTIWGGTLLEDKTDFRPLDHCIVHGRPRQSIMLEGKPRALSLEITCNFRLWNRADTWSTQFLALTINVETTVVYTEEYPITLPMVGTGQMSRLNALCLPTVSSILLTKSLSIVFRFSIFSYAACCDFLQQNNLLSIIRAHEAQDAG